MKYDLVLKNGVVITSKDKYEANLGITEGKIVNWMSRDQEYETLEEIDCKDKFILPGIVDMHFHCRVPGRNEREDFDTATKAASRGGVTTLAEMPIANPSPSDKLSFNNRVNYAKERAVIDFAFYGAGATGSEEKANELAKAGAVAFKAFLHASPKGREREFKDLCITDNNMFFKSILANKNTGLITCIHAEDDGLIRGLTDNVKANRSSYLSQMETRPPEAEELAVYTAGMISKASGGKVHICHVSSKDAADTIHYLQKKGVDITAETCPHYLLLDTDLMKEYGTLAKVNPPLRDEENRYGLLKALKAGTIKAVASDHAPFLPKEKQVDDFLAAPSGMPAVEFLGPIMWNEVFNGKWSWTELARWMSEEPAKLLNIYPKKGHLQVGADGDFLIIDPNETWTVDVNKLFTKSKYSAYPFQSKKYRGKLCATFVRGKKVYEEDKILVSQGYGNFIPGCKYEE